MANIITTKPYKMMKKIFFFLFLSMPLLIVAQNPVLLKIDNKNEVTLDEFKRIYLKNSIKDDELLTQDAVEDYLNLFINFKLKVYEAMQLGMDKQSEFTNELKKYRDQLAEPYLVDQSYSEQLYREAYERMFKIIKASHILLQLPQSPTPEDTLTVYNKALELKKKLEDGEPFYLIALKYSQDPSSKTTLGQVGYFSSMRMVYPFENAAYNTPVGQYTNPVKTQFGYHIIHVTDKIDIQGPIDVSYIAVRSKREDLGKETNTALEKINAAYDSLSNGVSIERAVRLFTEDKSSLPNNGLIRKHEAGRMFPDFDSIAWRLNENEFSKPFYSPYNNAWFIVYVNKKYDNPSYEEALDMIKRKIDRMPHSYMKSKSLATKLLGEYKAVRQTKAFDIAVDSLAEIHKRQQQYSKEADEYMNQPILIIQDTFKIAQSEFMKFINAKIKLKIDNMKGLCETNWQEFVERSIINYENQILHIKYPEFRYTVQEYHDGILLFNITDSLVWQKATSDTTGLKNFYEKVSHNYVWNDRANALLITANNPTLKGKIEKAIKKELKKKNSLAEDFGNRMQKQLKDSSLKITTEKLLVEKGVNNFVDNTGFTKGFSVVNENNNEIVWCYISEIIPSSTKDLREVRGLVTAEYQNELEKEWINSLKAKYSVEINKSALDELFKK